MPAPRRLTDAQLARVRSVLDQRRRLIRELAQLPTLEILADDVGLSVTALKKISSGATYCDNPNEKRCQEAPGRCL